KSISKKLISIFLAVTIIPLFINVFILLNLTNKGFNHVSTSKQKQMVHIVENELDRVTVDLLHLTNTYANKDKLVEALQLGDRSKLQEAVQQFYENLNEEHNIEVFEIGDTSGTVLIRGHNLAKYGDNKS